MRPQRIYSLVLTCILSLFAGVSHAQVVNGAPASNLLGQSDQSSLANPIADYTRGLAHDAPNRSGLSAPRGVAYDTSNHRLLVSDTSNNRVLVYNLTSGNLLIDHVPDFVLGQSNFASNSSATTRSTMNQPAGLAIDTTGNRLFVADRGNNRVLVFDIASITNGEDAAAVLGQAGFSSNSAAVTISGMSDPVAVAYDVSGDRLFVSQSAANRITVYHVDVIGNGEDATIVLGQSGFNGSASANTAAGLNDPRGLLYDAGGNRLFVAIAGSNRVFIYDNAGSLTVGHPANSILGQANLAGTGPATTSVGMNTPTDVSYDPGGNRLFVSDGGNSRITVYDLSTLTDGAAAVNVLGQADFTSGGAATSRNGMSSPYGLAYDSTSGRLAVSEIGNHRVVLYDVTAVTDGENAADLVGQYDETNLADPVPSYTRAQANNVPNRLGLNEPRGIAIDTTHHRLFVSESQNQRVLVYNLDANNTLIDRVPDNVLGEDGYLTIDAQTSASGFSTPEGIAYDEVNNRLFVVDRFNNRVLVFDVAAISDGEDAIRVLGQPSFTDSSANTTANGMSGPSFIALDVSGDRLFVTDSTNHRVLVFNTTAITDGDSAVNVLGQPDFTTVNAPATTATSFGPLGLAYDADTKSLFVADQASSRVLVFDATTIADNEPAVNVIGQPNLTTGTFGISAAKVSTPVELAVDSVNDRLFVAQDSNRITVFDIASITNGEDAVGVLGQSVFTTSSSGTTRTTLMAPHGVAVDPGSRRLYAADRDNHRVVVYQLDARLDYSASSFHEAVVNDGTISTPLTLTLENDTFTVTNGAMTPGVHYTVGNLPAGLTLVVTATSATAATITITGAATAHESVHDVSNITVSFLDAALTMVPAAGVSGSTKTDLAIDFDDAPTPTPTSTPTLTPTFTSTPTITPTATPTSTSTVTATPTGAETASPSVTPTTPPTVTPTVAPGQISGCLVDQSGKEIAGAVVYLFRESNNQAGTAADGKRPERGGDSSTITDDSGRYVFNGVAPGTYRIQPALAAFSFTSAIVSVGDSGVAVPAIEGSPVDLNDEGCDTQSTAAAIVSANDAAKALRELSLANAGRFMEQAAKELPSSKSRMLSRSLENAESNLMRDFGRLLTLSSRLPTVTLACGAKEGCRGKSSKQTIRAYRLRLDNMRGLALFIVRRSRDALGSIGNPQRLSTEIRRAHKAAFRASKMLPARTDVCR